MGYVEKTTKDGKVVKLKDYKKRVRRNKFKRKLLLLCFIVFIVIMILLYAPFMKVKTISCTGNTSISAEEIISASKICKGNNIFRINKSKAIDYIENFSYIKSVKIDRKLPSTVNIIVEECKLSAYVLNKKEYIYLDETGKVLQTSDTPPTANVPVVVGAKIVNSDVNKTIEFKDDKQLNALMDILECIEGSRFNGLVTIVDITKTDNTKFTLNNILDIILGDTENLDYKINFMASGAYDNLGGTRGGTLDVSYGSTAVFKEKQ